MRLRFWKASQSSTLVMMEGCLDRPKTSAPRRKTRVATYWFAPLIRLTTAITAATPMSVRMLRSLCVQRLEGEMATASEKFIVDVPAIAWTGAREPQLTYALDASGITCLPATKTCRFDTSGFDCAEKTKRALRTSRSALECHRRAG